MGLFTVVLTSGAHIAPIVGGLVGQFLGWRWIFKLAAIMDGVVFITILFGLPETLYVRDQNFQRPPTSHEERRSLWYLSQLKPYAGPFPGLKLRLADFVWPALRMAKYPSILFPAAYYGAQYGFASILPAVTVAAIFKASFGWNTLQIGLAYGTALTIGGILGESVAGVVLDFIVKRARTRRQRANPDSDIEPEVRLQAIWTGAILVPVGLLIYGFAIQYRVHWFVSLFGMAVGVFGLQPIATTCYTYSIECYRDRGADVATFFNFLRQCFGVTFAFYVVDMCERIGYHVAFILCVIWGSILGFAPIVVLTWKGKSIRGWVEQRERRR